MTTGAKARAPAMQRSSTQRFKEQTYPRREHHSQYRVKTGRWSDEEVTKLKSLEARGLTLKEIGRQLKRSRAMVASKRRYMGIQRWTSTTRSKLRFEIVWSDREKRLLRENYRNYGQKALAERLARSVPAVAKMAVLLGATRPKHRDWKAADFAVLTQPISVTEMATLLQRTKNAVHCQLGVMRGRYRPTRAYRESIAMSKKRSAPKRNGRSKCSVF